MYMVQASKREIPDLMSWLQYFRLYVAVVISKDPGKAKELWAYQAFVISIVKAVDGYSVIGL